MDRTEKLTQRVPYKETTNTPNEQAHELLAGDYRHPRISKHAASDWWGNRPIAADIYAAYGVTSPKDFPGDSTLEATLS